MATTLQDPSFELGTGWSYSGPGGRVSDEAYAGTWSARVRTEAGFGGAPDDVTVVTSEAITFDSGTDILVSYWYKEGDNLGDVSLIVEYDPDAGGNWTELATHGPFSGASNWTFTGAIFTATGGSQKIRFRSSGTASSIGSTNFWVDVVAVTEDTVAVSKHSALQGLVTRLKAINGSGYYHDLGNRVYPRLLYPQAQSNVAMPYACVPLVDDAPVYQHRGDGQVVTATWTLRAFVFVPETLLSNIDSGAAIDAAKMHDDIWRAVMEDITLGGSVRDLSIVSCNSWAGDDDREAPYGEVQLAVQVKQVFQRSDLGPDA